MAAIRSEGGLLPADLLARVAALDRDLGGLAVSDFHLAPNERLGEAIARSWARLTAAWEAFSTDRDELPAGDHAGKLTRERWLLPLFSELGYGRLIQQSGIEIDGKTYAVFCEYNHSPLHLVGAGVPLDRRTSGVRGAADQSPHSVVQELLNRSSERLWGIVTNGLSLRVLRDNVTLTRQAYVEFDLEAIFATEAYEDFALLWLCAHQSRFEAEAPEECWLERWTQAAQRDGTRALGELRSGVERAIEALGRGFLIQPANIPLHSALRDGSLDGPAYYGELLRLIYRLLFLFVAEDRDALLLPDDGTPARFDARELYDTYYGTKRLRRLSVRRRGGRAHDLYEQIKLLSRWLHDGGQPLLALPPLGSALWDPDTTEHISNARLGNEALLEALRELSYVEGGRRPVDFRNLGAEELGSVYESLLELHPAIDRDAAHFALTTAAGHERKQTGSYYTPTSLIGSLLESALDPVIDAAVKSDFPEQALLDLTVCDPACGSGHFLIAAANRIAKRLAAIREHDPEPAPEAIRHALRDVVSRCVHAVDVNPMAVELCKVSLWLEALEPGRPLSFLDDRILCGNSLLGTTPALIEAGVPDDAFKPLLGDDKDVVKAWRQHNVKERRGQTTLRLDSGDPARDAASLAALADRQRAIADDTAEGVRAREAAYAQITASDEHERLRLAADAWVAACSTPKHHGAARITTGVVRRAAARGRDGLSPEELEAVSVARDVYRPLHWHVAFPAVFRAGTATAGQHRTDGGFDCVLGNPPWERVKLQEKEYFAGVAPDIAAAKSKTARDLMIAALELEHPDLYAAFTTAKRRAEGESHMLRSTGLYPMCGRGDVNTYAVFAESMRSILAPAGRLGVIVPTGIATDDTTKLFFADIVDRGSLVSLYDFENTAPMFEGVHRSYKFCLLTIAGAAREVDSAAEFAFFAHRIEDLNDPERRFELTAQDIALLNPNTKTCPIFRTRLDAELTKAIYRRVPVVIRESDPNGNPWRIKFSTMFHMTNDSPLFRTRDELEAQGWIADRNTFALGGKRMLPVYEGKMVAAWNHRSADIVLNPGNAQRQQQKRPLTESEKRDPENRVMPYLWAAEAEVEARNGTWPRPWSLTFKRVSSSTNRRTIVPAIIPLSAVSYTLYRVDAGGDPISTLAFGAVLSSFVFDYVIRQKTSQPSVTMGVVYEAGAPTIELLNARIPRVAGHASPSHWLAASVAALAYSATDLDSLREDVKLLTVPCWDNEARFRIQSQIDAGVALAYGCSRDELGAILDSFTSLREAEEEAHGHFAARDNILAWFDHLGYVAAGSSWSPDEHLLTARV